MTETTALESQIRSQPDELRRTTRIDIEPAVRNLGACSRIWLVGTGTSQHAAELGASMLREAGIEAYAMPAMQFSYWGPPHRKDDGVVIITHTAETAYALWARSRALAAGATVVPITRTGVGLPDAIETVGKETSETYTVSYTTCLLVLARIAGALGAGSLSSHAIAAVPEAVRAAIDDPGIDGIRQPERLLVLFGAGPASITAREGALKVREASRFTAEGYDAEYLLHGSAVPLTEKDRLVALVPPDDRDGFVRAVAKAGSGNGVPTTTLAETSELPLLLAQIPLTVRLQLLALRFALERKQNPDTVITGAWNDQKLWSLGSPSA